jgi:hypothetical protein
MKLLSYFIAVISLLVLSLVDPIASTDFTLNGFPYVKAEVIHYYGRISTFLRVQST